MDLHVVELDTWAELICIQLSTIGLISRTR